MLAYMELIYLSPGQHCLLPSVFSPPFHCQYSWQKILLGNTPPIFCTVTETYLVKSMSVDAINMNAYAFVFT